MSKQTLEAFKKKLAADENLRNEMTRTLSQDGKKTTASVGEMLAFAQSKGYELSVEDVGGAMELSEDDLESVSGGILDSTTSSYTIKLTSSFSIESFSFNFVKI